MHHLSYDPPHLALFLYQIYNSHRCIFILKEPTSLYLVKYVWLVLFSNHLHFLAIFHSNRFDHHHRDLNLFFICHFN